MDLINFLKLENQGRKFGSKTLKVQKSDPSSINAKSAKVIQNPHLEKIPELGKESNQIFSKQLDNNEIESRVLLKSIANINSPSEQAGTNPLLQSFESIKTCLSQFRPTVETNRLITESINQATKAANNEKIETAEIIDSEFSEFAKRLKKLTQEHVEISQLANDTLVKINSTITSSNNRLTQTQETYSKIQQDRIEIHNNYQQSLSDACKEQESLHSADMINLREAQQREIAEFERKLNSSVIEIRDCYRETLKNKSKLELQRHRRQAEAEISKNFAEKMLRTLKNEEKRYETNLSEQLEDQNIKIAAYEENLSSIYDKQIHDREVEIDQWISNETKVHSLKSNFIQTTKSSIENAARIENTHVAGTIKLDKEMQAAQEQQQNLMIKTQEQADQKIKNTESLANSDVKKKVSAFKNSLSYLHNLQQELHRIDHSVTQENKTAAEIVSQYSVSGKQFQIKLGSALIEQQQVFKESVAAEKTTIEVKSQRQQKALQDKLNVFQRGYKKQLLQLEKVVLENMQQKLQTQITRQMRVKKVKAQKMQQSTFEFRLARGLEQSFDQAIKLYNQNRKILEQTLLKEQKSNIEAEQKALITERTSQQGKLRIHHIKSLKEAITKEEQDSKTRFDKKMIELMAQIELERKSLIEQETMRCKTTASRQD